MNYLVDSDILISAAGGRPDAQQLLADLSAAGLAICVISLGEVYEGAVGEPDPAGSEKLAQLRAYLHAFPILNLSYPVMERFARVRSELRQQGQLIPHLDLLIAATALVHRLTLATRNRRHFERIPELPLHDEG